MRITSKGRVAIEVHDGVAGIVPVEGASGRGQRAVAALIGRGDVALSTDEIMAWTRGE